MPAVDLSVGTVEYEDTGGEGPVLVFLHGVSMDGSVWRHVVADLRADYRCVLPTLPLGGHRIPARPDADLSLAGLALLVDEFLERLGLRDVTLVQNDWGGAQVMVALGRAERLARMVLVACEGSTTTRPGCRGAPSRSPRASRAGWPCSCGRCAGGPSGARRARGGG